MHLADHNPDRPGLELFVVHEGSPYGWDLHDAATGKILFKATGSSDNGRGMAAQLSATDRGSYFSSSNDKSQRSAITGNVASSGNTSMNFRIYWDGDLQEELFDGGKIDKWNGNGTSRLYINGKNPYDYNASSTCNGTKSTPNLQADLFGDWREEIILWSANDNATLNIFTTCLTTNFRVPTLMHDHTYRMGIAWQNVAYNQPPHIGYYLPDSVGGRIFLDAASGEAEQTIELGDSITPIIFHYKNATGISKSGTYATYGLAVDIDKEAQTITIHGTPTKTGTARYVLKTQGNDMQASVKGTIVVNEASDIAGVEINGSEPIIYDLFGRRVKNPQGGIYIVNGQKVRFE
jgi:rhamnogalacturonan endolyase